MWGFLKGTYSYCCLLLLLKYSYSLFAAGDELEELTLSGAAMAAQLAAQDRLPLKHKMLKVVA